MISSSSESLVSPTARHGSIPAAKQLSDFQIFPMPASARWSSSASPTLRAPSARRRRRSAAGSSKRSAARASGRRTAPPRDRRSAPPARRGSPPGARVAHCRRPPRRRSCRGASGARDPPRSARGGAFHRPRLLARSALRATPPSGPSRGGAAAYGSPREPGPLAPAGCGRPRGGSCRLRASVEGRRMDPMH